MPHYFKMCDSIYDNQKMINRKISEKYLICLVLVNCTMSVLHVSSYK
jgi:hypothetical protein